MKYSSLTRKTPLRARKPLWKTWDKTGKPVKTIKPLRSKGISAVSTTKQEIQDTVRKIVILRDGGCIFRENAGWSDGKYRFPICNGYAKDGHLILQADHLITRANSATYADTRLIVCVCKGHHGWKKYYEKEYEFAVKNLISPERVSLWDRAESDRHKHQTHKTSWDWKSELVALEQELKSLQEKISDSALFDLADSVVSLWKIDL